MSNLNQYGFTNEYGEYKYTMLYMPTDDQIGNSYIFEVTLNKDNPKTLRIITIIVVAVKLKNGLYGNKEIMDELDFGSSHKGDLNVFKIISSSEPFEPNNFTNKYLFFEHGWKVIG